MIRPVNTFLRAALPAVLSAVIFGMSACQPETSATGTAITNVTVIDAINGIRENHTVVFDGDRIIAVEPSGSEAASNQQAGREIVDGTGKFLIPGLWDFHVHLTYDAALTESMPAMFLSYGITSVRDTGALMHEILPVIDSMRAPDAVAPRVYFSGPLLDGGFVVYDGNARPEIGVRNATPAEAASTVADLSARGVDFIKIYELVSPETFTALVDAARQHDLPIDSHVPLSLRASIAGGSVDSIEHLRNIELDCAGNAQQLHEVRLSALENPDDLSGYELRASLHKLQRLPAIANYDEAQCDETLSALTNTLQVPTLRLNAIALSPPYRRYDWSDALGRLPDSVAQEWLQASQKSLSEPVPADTTFADWSLFLVGRMHEQGIPIGAGTDTPIGLAAPGYSLHSELEMLVQAGLTPLQAIHSATVRPAEYFSIEGELGTIEVGKKADLVLLDADPLQDITNTRRISVVISKGRVLTPDALLQSN